MDRHGPPTLLLTALAAAACALGTPGCDAARLTAHNLSAFASTPAKVPGKLTHPVRKDARLAVTWIGHATALVQMDDRIILTDPVFTTSVAQLNHRIVEPGVDVDVLPPLDAVVISHMHFDHLSLGSLDMIEPKVRRLFVPLGGIAYIPDYAFDVTELATWASADAGGVRVTAVPADHAGFRYGADIAWMTTSFAGWVFEYHGLSVYFAGDTAYQREGFRAIREHFPHLDVALLPIAPMEPAALMRKVHIDPAQALDAFADVGAAHMVPIHFGTFIEGTDEPEEAPRELDRLVRARGLGAKVVRLAIGEQHVFVARAP